MVKSLSSLEVAVVVKELQVLCNSKLQKVFQKGDVFLFNFFLSSFGRLSLKCVVGKLLFLSSKKSSFDVPSEFCSRLRKLLSGAVVVRVEQVGSERIVRLWFKKVSLYSLIFELFSRGNILLLESDKILASFATQKRGAGIIRPGAQYVFPPSRFDWLHCSEKDFFSLLSSSNKDSLAVALAVDVGLGGVYAEEVLARAGILDRSFSEKNFSFVWRALFDLRSLSVFPVLYGCEPFPFPLVSKSEAYRPVESFSLALESSFIPNGKSKKGCVEVDQSAYIRRLEVDEKDARSAADALYNRYSVVHSLLEKINSMLDSGVSWGEIESVLSSNKLVKEVNLKEKFLVLEL